MIKLHKIWYYLKVYQLEFTLTANSAFKRYQNYCCYNSHPKSAIVTELKTICSGGCNPKEATERKNCELLPDIQDLGLFARTSACEQDTQKRDHIDHSACVTRILYRNYSGFSLQLF